MPEADPRDRRRSLERHLHSVLLSILIYLAWQLGSTLVALDKRSAVIEAQMGQLYAQVAAMYRATDAQRDMAEVSRRIEGVERRVDSLERATREAVAPTPAAARR